MRIYQNEKDLLSFYLKIIFLIDNKKSDYRSNRFSVIQVTFINRLIINCLYNCIAYNMPTFLIYYRLFLT